MAEADFFVDDSALETGVKAMTTLTLDYLSAGL